MCHFLNNNFTVDEKGGNIRSILIGNLYKILGNKRLNVQQRQHKK